MISMLKGHVAQHSGTQAVILVGGIGYLVNVPLGTQFRDAHDHEVTLHTMLIVRQDCMDLYGFMDQRQREIFALLLNVSGIGPKIAMNIISGMAVHDLLQAISGGDVGKLVSIPGVGKKMAERLILELKEKVIKKMMAEQPPAADDRQKAAEMIKEDVLSALVNLGYKNNAAKDALDKVMQISKEELTLDALLKKTLKILAG